MDFVVWSGLAVGLVYNQPVCVLMVALTPAFSSKGVLFCLHTVKTVDTFLLFWRGFLLIGVWLMSSLLGIC